MSKKEKKDFVYRAYYEGGSEALGKFIAETMKYPEEAMKKRIQGTVKLKLDINYKGKVRKVKVISGLGYGCDEEAVRLGYLLEFKVPKTHKLKVNFTKRLSIHFKLKKTITTHTTEVNYTYSTPKTEESGKGSYSYTINIR